MQLFKRALLSLFPDEITQQHFNPASMFVSFISTKDFFSVINRKIVENYKLNLFDIALDPFEFKTGFGENLQAKPKDNEIYYGYCIAANLNGYRFFNCANISNTLTLVTSIYTKEVFLKYGENAYLNFLYATYLLSFVFRARIKIFPHNNKEKNYNRFIETFFNFYEFISSQTEKKTKKEDITKIKKDILNKTKICFTLFLTYKKINEILTYDNTAFSDKDLYNRIFYDELKENEGKNIIYQFIENYEQYTKQTSFSFIEKNILQGIFPADILIKYIFLDMDMFLITETIISKIYDKKTLDKYIESFCKNDSELENFLLYITDYKHFKKNFFSGVQKYLITILRDNKLTETEEELDELMSSIGDEKEFLENFKIPEKIKKESKIIEKILNFYITLIGGFRISRGDSFFLRIFRKNIIDEILKNISTLGEEKNYNLHYYGSLLYNYGKNIFYYKYASENVRAGKQKFFLPYKSNIKNIYSNNYIFKLFDENYIATLFQDINPKELKIFIKNKNILDTFKKMFSRQISNLVKQNKNEMIKDLYAPLLSLLTKKEEITKIIQENITEKDRYYLKENIYNLDFRLGQAMYIGLADKHINLKKHYSDQIILGICANSRETLFGFMLFIAFLFSEEKKTNKNYKIHLLKKIYITDILHITTEKIDKIQINKILNIIYTQFEEILQYRITIDDNQDFLKLSTNNRGEFIEINKNNISDEEILKKISGEDIIRFKGFLKNISYYNKRFIIPK